MVPEDTVPGSDLSSGPAPAQSQAQPDASRRADGAKPATSEPATQPRLQTHSRSSCEEQPAGTRKPGRSRGSERPPPGPLSPNPGRPSGFGRDVNRRSLERPERASRPVATMERSRSASSLSSRGTYSPGPRSSGRLLEKDSKGSPQVGLTWHPKHGMLEKPIDDASLQDDHPNHCSSHCKLNIVPADSTSNFKITSCPVLLANWGDFAFSPRHFAAFRCRPLIRHRGEILKVEFEPADLKGIKS